MSWWAVLALGAVAAGLLMMDTAGQLIATRWKPIFAVSIRGSEFAFVRSSRSVRCRSVQGLKVGDEIGELLFTENSREGGHGSFKALSDD